MVLDLISMFMPKGDMTIFPTAMELAKSSKTIFPILYREAMIEQKKKGLKKQCPVGYRLGIDGRSYCFPGSSTIH